MTLLPNRRAHCPTRTPIDWFVRQMSLQRVTKRYVSKKLSLTMSGRSEGLKILPLWLEKMGNQPSSWTASDFPLLYHKPLEQRP
jgi:hypothetical protein